MQATPLRSQPRQRPAPTREGLRDYLGSAHRGADALAFEYAPAPSGVDTNVVVLLHGLGDSSAPFMRLGRTLQRTLPQTAILSVNAPLRVPLLEEAAWMWWDSFDMLGESTSMLTSDYAPGPPARDRRPRGPPRLSRQHRMATGVHPPLWLRTGRFPRSRDACRRALVAARRERGEHRGAASFGALPLTASDILSAT